MRESCQPGREAPNLGMLVVFSLFSPRTCFLIHIVARGVIRVNGDRFQVVNNFHTLLIILSVVSINIGGWLSDRLRAVKDCVLSPTAT